MTHSRHRVLIGGLLLLLLSIATALRPSAAVAHPLGNFTTNRYSRLDFADGGVTITYVLDFAEIPTFQQMQRLDTDGDGQLSEAETTAYLDHDLPTIMQGLRLVVGDSVLPLQVVDRALSLSQGQGGLSLLRLEAHFSATLPDGWEQHGVGGYTDRNYSDRLGWRELIIRGGPGVRIAQASAPDTDVSNELRAYPQSFLSSPLNVSEATFTLAAGDGTVLTGQTATSATKITASNSGGRATARITALITAKELTPSVIIISILAAAFWGAVHALTPGHGKTIVAAYLVGARGTARHAAFLGLTVTLTHTAGVFALGLVTLYLSRFILPEVLYPWLGVASGALVVLMGVTLAYSRFRSGAQPSGSHDHGSARSHTHAHPQTILDHDDHTDGDHVHTHPDEHSHLPPGAAGGPITARSLIALGISGGLIPCPSALILLLGAIALGRLEFGIVLVLAFSVGLAGVLTGVGIALVYARRLFQRFSMEVRVPRLLPVASALIICVAGVLLVIGSLGKTGVI